MNSKPDRECEERGDIVFLSVIITNSMYDKKSVVEPPSNLGLILEHITVLAEVWILNLSTLYINLEKVGYFQKKIT